MLSRDLKREREYKLVQLLEKNIADESEARQGYFAIFQEYFDDLSMDEIWQIKEIIAEELKHTEMLQKMIRKRTKIDAED
jgi:rubrerythrin